MKAVVYHGKEDVRVDSVPDPTIVEPTDAILKITSAAICGSDLHLYDGYNPTMKEGDILGHEFMGEVVEVGKEVKKVKKGDKIVVPFNIACGACFFCKKDLWSLCDSTNPNPAITEKMYGYHAAGLYGYSHAFGGYCGAQAQYVRVVKADVNHLKVPHDIPDEKVLFLGDIFPTGYMAALNCDIQKGDTIAVFGCGPVGQFAIRSALMLGAKRVIAIDFIPERLHMAKEAGNVETINFEEVDNFMDTLRHLTSGLGPDACIDAVGMESHGMSGLENIYDKAKQAVRLETDRGSALRNSIHACRKGGTVSVPGVYMEFIDKMNMGAFMNKALTMRTGQTHTHRFMEPLFKMIQENKIDPSFVITHRLPLEKAPEGYKIFRDKEDKCIKVVLDPWT